MKQVQKRVAVRWEDAINRQFLPAHENLERQVGVDQKASIKDSDPPIASLSGSALRIPLMCGIQEREMLKMTPAQKAVCRPFWKLS
jgi:hypothetical protein